MLVRHFYLASIAVLVGIFSATIYSPTWPTLVWLMGLSIVLVLFWRRSPGESGEVWLGAGILLAFFVLGATRFLAAELNFGHSPLENQVGQTVSISGEVSREPDERESSKHLYVKIADGQTLLVTTDRYTEVFYGDVVTVTGQLKRPEPFRTDLGRMFNYPGYLLARGVEYQIAFAEVAVTRSGEGNTVVSGLLRFKSTFMNGLEGVLAEPAVGLGEGLLLGVKRALGEELETAFRKTGIIHIVVLSGYNVMLVVTFVMFVLGYFFRPRIRVVFGIMAIVLFAILVGLSATVVRASLMASLLLLAHSVSRLYIVLRALLLAAIVMVFINPYLLVYDIGFQLSFLATLGLILISPIIEAKFSLIPESYGAKKFLVATIATQIAVLPLLLYHIGEFSLVAIIVNVLVLPAVPIAMLLTFLTGVTAQISTVLALLVSWPTYFVLQYINEVALWFASFPFSSLIVPAFPFYVVPTAYLLLAYWVAKNYDLIQSSGSGDLAQDLLKSTLEKNHQADDLSDWVIVEEESDDLIKRKRESKSDKASKEIPSFFR